MPTNKTLTLSPRENECLNAAARGMVSADIASELGLSVRTIDSHIANAMRKLGAQTRVEAVATAFRLGVLK